MVIIRKIMKILKKIFYYPKIFWYHILVLHTKVQRYFGKIKDKSII